MLTWDKRFLEQRRRATGNRRGPLQGSIKKCPGPEPLPATSLRRECGTQLFICRLNAKIVTHSVQTEEIEFGSSERYLLGRAEDEI